MTLLDNGNKGPSHLSPVRILLVDDFAPWRRLIRSLIEERDGFEVVGEATDGRDAIRKAEELRPDLVLLDINLPYLNGIEVSRQIQHDLPSATILHVAVNTQPDLVRTALNNGAKGYVVKSRVVQDLCSAIDSVLQGNQFVSCGLGL